jgi:hypothetical protein
MRINRPNTLIEDNSYPLAGMHDDDVYGYFTEVMRPYAPLINQIQGALMLHNVPLFFFMVVTVVVFLYSLKTVRDSDFPTILYLVSLYPFVNLLLKIGGANGLKSLSVDLPELPRTAPDRIRSIEEMAEIFGKPMLFAWRVGFFVYRTFCCPNVVDITVFLFLVFVVGFLCCVIDVVVVLTLGIAMGLTFPAVLTRRIVYNVLVLHLGRSLGDPEVAMKGD